MLALTIFHSALHGSFAFIALGPKAPQTSSQLHLFDLLNEGKKALIRNMAGEYDAEAVRHWMFVFLSKFFRLSELTVSRGRVCTGPRSIEFSNQR
jgi:hypothetical protein